MRALNTNPNIDNSDLVRYPGGRIKDNTGAGDGTPVNERTKGDIHQAFEKLMRLYSITPTNLPDNEENGFQLVDALIALASKNDYILPITSSGGFLVVPVKLASMKENEQIVCKAGVDLTIETQIKGSDASTFTFTLFGSFKANEYVRLIKTASGVNLVRLADNESLNLMVAGFLYLKKATQAEENAGAIDTKATTPLSNLTAFIKRVNGSDSPTYLATGSINGLYPKEHFAIVAALGASDIKNKGTFAGLDVGSSVGSLAVSGDFTVATATTGTDESFVLVTMTNAMDDLDYYVESFIESQGTIGVDNDINREVFKPISTTQFQISISGAGGSQSLKFHMKVIQNS